MLKMKNLSQQKGSSPLAQSTADLPATRNFMACELMYKKPDCVVLPPVRSNMGCGALRNFVLHDRETMKFKFVFVGRLSVVVSKAFVALFTTILVANASAFSNQSDPKDLIGLETNGPFYPFGWKQIGSDGFGQSRYILSTLQINQTYAFLLKKQINEPKKGERIRAVVTDAIAVANPTSNHRFSRLCYFPEQAGKKTETNIFAEVGFAKYCDMKTKLIRRAWQINLETGKFDQLYSTKGLTCEYGFVSLGEPDSREGCPSYNWR